MDPETDTQPTQATQNALDPRRLGQQNSGFSDEDISDIICLLHPNSANARKEVQRLAGLGSPYVVGKEEGDDLDYYVEDDASRFGFFPAGAGQYTIALRLSVPAKNPLQGFTFGRNEYRCDISLGNDPLRRLSNIHFRIYINDYGVLMIEDTSTNGTIVDEQLLKSRSKHPNNTRRTLNSGSTIRILVHEHADDYKFIVRIPRREGDNETVYRRNMNAYLKRLRDLAKEEEQTVRPGPSGHVDLFSPATRRQSTTPANRPRFDIPDDPTEDAESLPRDWNGSDKYNRVGQIGKGAFATVYKVTSRFTGSPFAAKELEKRHFMKNGVLDQKVENEMNIMQKVQHPNIVQYIEHFDWDNRLFIIIMEFVPGGDLGGLINKKGSLNEATVKVMACQLLDALGYLHGKNITHRDVKPDNILIQSFQPFQVKLTDFGLSKMVDNEQTFLRTFCGTLLYCAPEVYSDYPEYDEYGRRNPRNRQKRTNNRQRYDHAVDIWSLGGVLFYALTASPPYPVKSGISYSELLNQIMTRSLDISPLVRTYVSADGIDFLTRMLHRRPEFRATVEELKEHAWLGGPHSIEHSQRAQSVDEVSDDGLEVGASQLSLQESAPHQRYTQQDADELIGADELVDDDQPIEYESKEYYTFDAHVACTPHLFGEVNVSAIGSSGVIAEERLNLPVSATSLDETEILGEIRDSFGSEDLSTPRQNRSQPWSGGRSGGGVPLSVDQSHSVEQLNNMTFDVASQSLGGAESIMEHLNMKSLAPSNMGISLSEFQSSKRKPSYESSDEFEEARPFDKPTIKRLKSDNVTESTDSDEEDYALFATIPPIARLQSGRQIDGPVHKATYWTNDQKTWHLDYPEMTQLQHDAFQSAAAARGEDFAPGQSVLWELAMKHFPPVASHAVSVDLGFSGISSAIATTGNGQGGPRSSSSPISMPGTLPPGPMSGRSPSDQHLPAPIPIRMGPPEPRPIASLESTPNSVIQGIKIPITNSLTSWGRGPSNTHIYELAMEVLVPKHALKIVLWREGHDPYNDPRPWENRAGKSPSAEDSASYHFYVSTKATNGIQINDTTLKSFEPKDPTGPSRNWIRLQDGDTITFWYSMDQPNRQAKLVFRCRWGGSASPRLPLTAAPSPSQASEATPAPSGPATIPSTPPPSATTLVPEALGRKLDDACHRATKRAERTTRIEAANGDFEQRKENIERERERSYAFELRRTEASRVMSLRSTSRRASPAGASPSPGSNGCIGGAAGSGAAALGAASGTGRAILPAVRPLVPSPNTLQLMSEEN